MYCYIELIELAVGRFKICLEEIGRRVVKLLQQPTANNQRLHWHAGIGCSPTTAQRFLNLRLAVIHVAVYTTAAHSRVGWCPTTR